MTVPGHDTRIGGEARSFPPTSHSAIVQLASPNAEQRLAAQEALVRAYWKPCYAYARWRWKLANEDAKELVQAFFARALEGELLTGFQPSRGRFRSFMRGCFDHHALHEFESARRVKRGGGAKPVALDEGFLDVLDRAPTAEDDLEARFRHEWVRRLYELAIESLRERADELGKAVAFEVFSRYDLHDMAAGPRPTYEEIAAALALPSSQVTNHLHWARRVLRERLSIELRLIVANEQEFAEEARWLLGSDVA